jgi:hypothetical protein
VRQIPRFIRERDSPHRRQPEPPPVRTRRKQPKQDTGKRTEKDRPNSHRKHPIRQMRQTSHERQQNGKHTQQRTPPEEIRAQPRCAHIHAPHTITPATRFHEELRNLAAKPNSAWLQSHSREARPTRRASPIRNYFFSPLPPVVFPRPSRSSFPLNASGFAFVSALSPTFGIVPLYPCCGS